MFWQVASYPKCDYHVFLSHCQEDRDGLVEPVHKSLIAKGLKPFLDIEDYYYGRESRVALRDGILDSRHVIFFITDAMLNSARGWCVMELAFAELLDANLIHRGGKLANVILPLFFVPQSDPRLPRSVWQLIRDRGRFCDVFEPSDTVTWCSDQISEFLIREAKITRNVAQIARQNATFLNDLLRVTGLHNRVTKFQPGLPKLPATPSLANPLL